MTAARELDTLVIGGGMVGMSVAYGLARAGERVRLLDGQDDALRAARGNFGLVWVQGKGQGNADYARWSMAAARQWPAFAQELAERTGVDLELSQVGGLVMHVDGGEMAAKVAGLQSIREDLGEDYPFEILDPTQLLELSPFVGPEVVGATYCPLDGHVSPLRLLRALVQGFEHHGGALVAGVQVDQIVHRHGEFRVRTGATEHVAAKLVLAAGLGNRALAPLVGLEAPVSPNRGQILVTERVQPFLRHPSLHVRQTGEGVVQIGDSKEDVGFDDGTTLAQLARIADRATRCFPLLKSVNIMRTWGALRVMSPDGFPIYQASITHPGAFVVTCHSGVTLAPQHAGVLADWIRGAPEPVAINGFKAERFHV
nr:FAD-dependent oxidoreductase [uncultured Albidiferax sp.]